MGGIDPDDACREGDGTPDERELEFLEYERSSKKRIEKQRRAHEESAKEQDMREWRERGGEIPG